MNSAHTTNSYQWRLEHPGETVTDPWEIIGGHTDPHGQAFIEFANGKCIRRDMYEAVLRAGPLPP